MDEPHRQYVKRRNLDPKVWIPCGSFRWHFRTGKIHLGRKKTVFIASGWRSIAGKRFTAGGFPQRTHLPTSNSQFCRDVISIFVIFTSSKTKKTPKWLSEGQGMGWIIEAEMAGCWPLLKLVIGTQGLITLFFLKKIFFNIVFIFLERGKGKERSMDRLPPTRS